MDERLAGFHVLRVARDRYQFEDTFFSFRGKTQIANFQAARGFANRMNQRRDIGNFPNERVQPSQINAVALINGITQHIFRLYCQRNPQILQNALTRLAEQFGPNFDKTLNRFLDEFPPQPVYRRTLTNEQYLAGEHDGKSNREHALEELLMLWLANANPAYSPLIEIFGDDALKQGTVYNRVTTELNTYFAEVAKGDTGGDGFPGGVNILDILLEPVRQSPHSLDGQLKILVERWGGVIGSYIYRLMTAMDIIQEEYRPIPGPGGPGGKGTTPVPFFDAASPEFEAENFTPDREWMPNLVMVAKNAYVWLDQLSKKHKREIIRLDQIPDDELDQLAAWGITGLWLIGLWERSTASQRIKIMCGNPDAVASAYSLFDYQIAARLGGDVACQNLRERAWKRGIRLASDMVPNHVGIDGRWVTEHPDWFVSLNYSPYPNYTFNGPDLSNDARIGIYLEDHYYDRSDAAVVFKRIDKGSGDTRYVYHGNDGTSMPWNDTAQLNYLNPEMREAMIQTILNIARQFPIIRFDAAMTLVKKHIQRLWFPEPGTGGAIPSRSEHGMTRAQLDQRMPEEFWREVVDRAAIEAPDTLLLAEAFWLLEGYFVRTLGMHRVYNSAFMNMMRDEENGKYRSVMKNTMEFDTEVLRRYVNFLNNPDEKTAVEQFGKGDKYFGVTMLMLTLPGLPMIGHGQIEGYAEKYGMEYYRAYWDEQADNNLIQRHEREIFPLCRKRYLFAGVDDFLLYDFFAADGVDENVFAFSNMAGDERALILYNNAFNSTRGWIKVSAAYSVKVGDGDNRRLIQRTLGEGLRLRTDDDLYCIYREHRSGLEYIQQARDLVEQGYYAELNGYQYIILMDWRIVSDDASGRYRELMAHLGRRGVPSIDEALREILVEPIRAPFRELVNARVFKELALARSTGDDQILDDIEAKMSALITAIRDFMAEPETEKPPTATNGAKATIEAATDEPPDITETVIDTEGIPTPEEIGLSMRTQLEAMLTASLEDLPESMMPLFTDMAHDETLWGGLYSWLVVGSLGDADQTRSWIDEWLLGRIINQALREVGATDDRAAQITQGVKLTVGRPDLFAGDETETAEGILEALLADSDAQQLLNINHFQGIVWFNQQGFDEFLRWLILLSQFDGTAESVEQRFVVVEQLIEAAAASSYQVDKLRAGLRVK